MSPSLVDGRDRDKGFFAALENSHRTTRPDSCHGARLHPGGWVAGGPDRAGPPLSAPATLG